MRIILILLVLSVVSCQPNPAKPIAVNTLDTTGVKKYDPLQDTTAYIDEMKRFWLVLLKSGTKRNQDSATAAQIQVGHMANIQRLAKEGKIIMAGPIGADTELRGIFIMNCKDSAEVEQIVKTDPAVIAGRLKMEYYPWWSAKGKFVFK